MVVVTRNPCDLSRDLQLWEPNNDRNLDRLLVAQESSTAERIWGDAPNGQHFQLASTSLFLPIEKAKEGSSTF